jgi:hypothetical protein
LCRWYLFGRLCRLCLFGLLRRCFPLSHLCLVFLWGRLHQLHQ